MAQRLLHLLKYEGRKEIAYQLGLWYGEELAEQKLKDSIDLIVPVPLHSSRLRTRGYNQSDYFAQGLSEALDIESSTKVLRRKKKTATQTQMGKVERWENVDNIFEVTDTNLIKGKNILVVDDVVTTGATLNSCIQSLINGGADKVAILTLASAN